MSCPRCGYTPGPECPPEPPIGTWVQDRHGGVSKRFTLGDMTGWAPPGCLPLAQWKAMWEARGPLTICAPWGHATTAPTR